MRKLSFLRRPGFLLLLAALISLVAVVAVSRNVHPLIPQQPQQPPAKVGLKVNSKIESVSQKLQLVGVQIVKGKIELKVRNGYNKPLTAVALKVNGEKLEKDLMFADDEAGRMLKPGEVMIIPLNVTPNQANQPVITFDAVVFDGDSHDGDTQGAIYVLNTRTAFRKQLVYIAPWLDNVARSTDEKMLFNLGQLREIVNLMPVEPTPKTARSLGLGLQAGKKLMDDWSTQLVEEHRKKSPAAARSLCKQFQAKQASFLRSLERSYFKDNR